MKIIERICSLREKMKENNLKGYMIPSTDPHNSEYVPARWNSRAYFSGFDGSAGTLVVLEKEAGLWTDGRYFLQAENQLKNTGITLFKMGLPETPSPIEWVNSNLKSGDNFGFDGAVVSKTTACDFLQILSENGINLITSIDLVEKLWLDRPGLPSGSIFKLEENYSGKSSNDKLFEVREIMRKNKVDYHLITTLDDIAWLFNLRGNDVNYNPIFVSYALIGLEKSKLYIMPSKVNDEIKEYLTNLNVEIMEYSKALDDVTETVNNSIVQIDKERINYLFYSMIKTASRKVIERDTITTLMKSKKNSTEIENMKLAHIKDGAALEKFFYWIEKNVGNEKISELSASIKLGQFRSEMGNYVQDSFCAISGYKGNGAIIHYRVTEETSLELKKDGLYLIDSGGQYFEGTTDVTRTITLGNPTDDEKEDFTLVLKGMIDLSMAKFPEGTRGFQLDFLARKAMWDRGKNFGHGTGHGVGMFLNVHEGPQNISPFPRDIPLQTGMVISNEPGRYVAGKYGIRIENLIFVDEPYEGEASKFFNFDTLTMCHIDKRLIDISLLNCEEINWLNNYHQKVYDNVSVFLNEEEKVWLKEKTSPLEV
ncbi:MAG: aminopeptidase P family protein [Candidatus Delongbacteria bacterium]|nr:aminopeptidase P family protein [Candidatus Delongbacteria bacterium]MBN2833343.1 aminopeptidase P family protein [Candidatus Delongbacteria bacterium]